ncbi:TPR repeat [Carpediemonas membranifera]|uniref:TPR repeat n=1 Tax=Carpediemonas membranifera TaxID=201153 RepID=A0A8J6DZD9_9EUKA|nr:TPR repeat [Carpediemonas membranifera]|eukprot:KAG9393489.1 TPR repeat [Carpediemonas membranifera]
MTITVSQKNGLLWTLAHFHLVHIIHTHSYSSFFTVSVISRCRTKQHQSGAPTGPWSGNKVSPPPSYDVTIQAVRHGVFGPVAMHWPLALAAHRDIRATLDGAEPGFKLGARGRSRHLPRLLQHVPAGPASAQLIQPRRRVPPLLPEPQTPIAPADIAHTLSRLTVTMRDIAREANTSLVRRLTANLSVADAGQGPEARSGVWRPDETDAVPVSSFAMLDTGAAQFVAFDPAHPDTAVPLSFDRARVDPMCRGTTLIGMAQVYPEGIPHFNVFFSVDALPALVSFTDTTTVLNVVKFSMTRTPNAHTSLSSGPLAQSNREKLDAALQSPELFSIVRETVIGFGCWVLGLDSDMAGIRQLLNTLRGDECTSPETMARVWSMVVAILSSRGQADRLPALPDLESLAMDSLALAQFAVSRLPTAFLGLSETSGSTTLAHGTYARWLTTVASV